MLKGLMQMRDIRGTRLRDHVCVCVSVCVCAPMRKKLNQRQLIQRLMCIIALLKFTAENETVLVSVLFFIKSTLLRRYLSKAEQII